MSVHWSTLVADANGDIDYSRVRQLVSVSLALCGGLLMVTAAALEIWRVIEIPTGQVVLVGGALVLPLTGGQIAGAIQNRLTKASEPAP